MKKLFLLYFLFSYFLDVNAQISKDRGDFRIAFYNVENLFDTRNDSITKDDEFTPEGLRHWSYSKYKKKINRISQVLMGIGEWEVPEVVGLCEVENRYVLEGIVRHTALSRFSYEIIHFDSPDSRGIDVAMLIQKERFHPIKVKAINVDLSEFGDTTRDILYVKGETMTQDTLHIFVNHWPSKYGGYLETIPKRIKAAETLKIFTDSILHVDPLSKIIIMGDFNTNANGDPLLKNLGAKVDWNLTTDVGLYNLRSKRHTRYDYGTYKYHGIWDNLDQFIVSNGMFEGVGSLFTSEKYTKIYNPDFLLEEDNKGGYKPFRTYIGMKYNNGFSDHLPIYLDLWRD